MKLWPLLLIVAGCAGNHSYPLPTIPIPNYPLPIVRDSVQPELSQRIWITNALGYFEFDCRFGPRAWIRVDLVGTEEERNILVHEKRHVLDSGIFETCNDFAQARQDLTFERNFEASAFCANAEDNYLQRKYPSLDAAIARFSAQLVTNYPQLNLSPDEAFTLIGRFCSPFPPPVW